MIEEIIKKEVEEFCKSMNVDKDILKIEFLKKPHIIKKLPKNRMAIYIFENNGIFYKIGKVGKNSNARFQSQHYNENSSKSNLAKSILKDSEVKIELDQTLKNYIVNNFNRINIYIDSSNKLLVNLLEAYLHYKLIPKYEG